MAPGSLLSDDRPQVRQRLAQLEAELARIKQSLARTDAELAASWDTLLALHAQAINCAATRRRRP
jgi:hypothetical protein